MKISLTLPNDLFDSAEKLVEERGVSRSSLYAEAMRFYLKQQGADKVMVRLNAYYATEDSRMDSGLRKAQAVSLRKATQTDEW
jgi:metal-responsive CopG/Arc/MetJ family transcriptional regulator